ncbi:uncharacterized protein A4U43_C07F520 [Asparagus officinalis]|uniref:Plastocyanin-like domain-containing protein n=1 Tax=Asparagus officinalis TaxID=4686 RepID=A0A5P1E853_ASPOF|nr:uncharacterized protein A4U43_C07F520 [Asparagus officinalis]
MTRFMLLITVCVFVLVGSGRVRAAVKEHTFNVGNLTVERLCESRVITAVNGKLPGPTIHVHDGDTLIVHVINDSPYNITIHWLL